mgnify:CR=1 FL=1
MKGYCCFNLLFFFRNLEKAVKFLKTTINNCDCSFQADHHLWNIANCEAAIHPQSHAMGFYGKNCNVAKPGAPSFHVAIDASDDSRDFLFASLTVSVNF